MLSDRQLSETLCFYYGFDAENGRILALPILASLPFGARPLVWRLTPPPLCASALHAPLAAFCQLSAVPPRPTRASAALSDAPLNQSHRLCGSVLQASHNTHRAALLPPAESRDLLDEQLIAHSPFSSVFYNIDSCSVSPSSSTYSTSSNPTSPQAVPCSASTSIPSPPFLHVLCPAETVDWREWIDQLIDEVRSEIHNETIFNNASSPSGSTTSSSSRKRKHPSSDSPCSDSGIGSAASTGSATPPPLTKRAKKYSLASLSHEQIAERKKEQNRIAAQRYRSRKTHTLEEGRVEIQHLESRNSSLRSEIEAMKKEIQQLKGVLVGANSS
ncbi:unnamed protein product [Bursaphelenchus okinawaensis]|uniref:BZIP domain-containing protein n=1 Tax=Bursaphelenchus okinawaensis TaxID=465554 RepID=A0A811L9A1_9BILA|nr:unnamed protein product [Bursaphelenchus okinawaensis]CAG9118625.1 unnamed protein product [Bursaphelenchus okinawaensis]